MKKSTIILLAVLLNSVQFSCKKYLDTVPTDFVSPQNYFNTETDINTALAGVYDPLGNSNLYGSIAQEELASSDEWLYKYSSVNAAPIVYNSPSGASDPTYSNYWNNLYVGINRANVFLENADKAVMDPAKKQAAKGEALFLRAYYYFLLVRDFGDVPLKLSSTQDTKSINTPRSPAKAVYDQIIADMTQAESMVRPITFWNYGGHVSQSAVQGILARVCLTEAGFPVMDVSKYKDALTWAQKVINSNIHSLSPDYKQIFVNYAQHKYDIKESIWEIEFYGNRTDSYNEIESFGRRMGVDASGSSPMGRSDCELRATPRTWLKYNDNDLRRDWNLALYSYGNGIVRQYYPIVTTVNGVVNKEVYNRPGAKFYREYENLLPRDVFSSNINWPILRFTDVLLMAAEADNEINGPSQTSIDMVNSLRRRAYGSGYKVTGITITNPGTGYTSNPLINIAPSAAVYGTLNGAVAVVTSVSGGNVKGAGILTQGALYTATPPLVTIGPPNTTGGVQATATVTVTPIGLNDADLLPVQTSSQAAFRQTIRDERFRELFNEGLRKYDLIRYGNFIGEMKTWNQELLADPATGNGTVGASFLFPSQFISNKNLLLPIPQSELNVNRAATQNTGW